MGPVSLPAKVIAKMYFHIRTAQMNDAVRFIFLISNQLDAKNRTKLDFSSLSDQVAGAGLNLLFTKQYLCLFMT
jgi:hypothetical protein